MSLGPALCWQKIEVALAALHEASGTPVPFWLRDDDAVAPSPSLDRLLDMAGEAGAPLALAVIPAGAVAELGHRLQGAGNVTVLQHGYDHRDRAGAGEKKCEFPVHRPESEAFAAIAAGRSRLAGFPHLAPVFVPPWNRIAPFVTAALPSLGFHAVSAFGDRPAPWAAPRLARFNTHLDPVDWRGTRHLSKSCGTRRFVGQEAFLSEFLGRIDRLANGTADMREATGILTHHRIHDAETFGFLEDFMKFVDLSPSCRWLSVQNLLSGETMGNRNAGV